MLEGGGGGLVGKGGLDEGWSGVDSPVGSAVFGGRVLVGSFDGKETITVRMLSTVIADVMVIFTCLKKFTSF